MSQPQIPNDPAPSDRAPSDRAPDGPLDPEVEGLLIDGHLGQLDAADAEALRARLAAEPAWQAA